jgi:hypothetical protein
VEGLRLGHDTDRLFKKGIIGDPVNNSKSLILTDESLERSEQLFRNCLRGGPLITPVRTDE